MSRSFKIDRKYVPMLATICLFVVGYVFGAIQYPGMARPQTFFNLFIDNAFLLIASTGLTLVILSGGIDLSVGAVIALTSVAAAYLMEHTGLSSLIVIPLMLLMGAAFGALMGG
ncbi:MAG: sugar ABC transporter permease YjfF, partial [Anaerolineae bacterium]|nr:sugar ABC transporter permease YjfF [Anaerolineae bacterium]